MSKTNQKWGRGRRCFNKSSCVHLALVQVCKRCKRRGDINSVAPLRLEALKKAPLHSFTTVWTLINDINSSLPVLELSPLPRAFDNCFS